MAIDPELFRWRGPAPTPTARKPQQRRLRNDWFIKGPIPWTWIRTACRLPGKAPIVGLALWFWSGLSKTDELTVRYGDLRELGVGRKAAYRCLQHLERARLVTVRRSPGRSPRVTLCDIPPD